MVVTRRARVAISAVLAGTLLSGLAPPVQAAMGQQPPEARTGAGAAPAASTSAAAAVSALTWVRCGGGLQCATLPVPLDHAQPSKGTTLVSIARRPADDPKIKQGVLFTNPGGPGVPASLTVPAFAQLAGRAVRQRFDIIGVDPRGFGGQDLALCEGKPGQKMPDYPSVAFPMTRAQLRERLAFDAAVRKLCRTSAPRILPYMSTADTARDMDRVRAALRQKQINYWGVSYGSMLGVTYAALFPGRVRSMIVDGAIDPVAWAPGRPGQQGVPISARLGSHVGSHRALMAAIAECERVGAARCAEHKSVRADWAALPGLLAKQPPPAAGQFVLTYPDVIGIITSGLYDPEGVPDVLRLIHDMRVMLADTVSKKVKPAAAKAHALRAQATYERLRARDAENRRTRIGYDPPTQPEDEVAPVWPAFTDGVMCGEGRNPADPMAWVRAAAAADRAAPGFGSLWTWQTSVCASWPFPAKNAYRGSYAAKPGKGLLIMNSLHDPATPYTGAQALHRLSPGSRLVTLAGWGHAVLDTSGCASWLRTNYLVSNVLPAKDVTCRPDHPLFTPLS